jgi:enterochelin esterase family protein
MKKTHRMFPLLVFATIAAPLAWAQQTSPAADDFKPASTNILGQQYPQVNSARQVRFRINAPQVQSIRVLGTNLVKGEDGVFTGTTAPQDPGFHAYQLTVDGFVVADPASESFFSGGKMTSAIEIPEEGVDFYDNKDVPHGEIRSHWYKTKSGDSRQAWVYTPPNYDNDPTKRFPVLYLQHGMLEERRAWAQQGHTNFILDNLIAEKRAVPMIVVMEDGGISQGMGGPRGGGRGGRGGASDGAASSAPGVGREGGSARGGGMSMPFTSQIINDIIPEIDAKFRTIADRDHRAMAGLSLGGTQTYQIAQANKDKFAYIGVFSAPFGFQGLNAYAASADEFDKTFKVFFISMGGKEGAGSGRQPAQTLKDASVKNVVYYEAPGTAHEFQTWRKSLREFAPLLFQN